MTCVPSMTASTVSDRPVGRLEHVHKSTCAKPLVDGKYRNPTAPPPQQPNES